MADLSTYRPQLDADKAARLAKAERIQDLIERGTRDLEKAALMARGVNNQFQAQNEDPNKPDIPADEMAAFEELEAEALANLAQAPVLPTRPVRATKPEPEPESEA